MLRCVFWLYWVVSICLREFSNWMAPRTWTDEQFIAAVNISFSQKQVARNLGLKGNNAKFVQRYANLLGVDISHLVFDRKKYTDEDLINAVRLATSVSDVLRRLKIRHAGGSHAHISSRIKALGLDTSHFGRLANGYTTVSRKAPSDILVVRPPGASRAHAYQLRRAMIEMGVPYICIACGEGPIWNDKPLTIQVEHKNGDRLDCRLENLEFLCPNCHTQTETYARNRKIID